MKKIKIPWMELIVIFQAQLEKIVDDIKEAREDDSKIDKEEIKDIIAENVVELVVPITQAFLKTNGIERGNDFHRSTITKRRDGIICGVSCL